MSTFTEAVAVQSGTETVKAPAAEGKKLKPCCACPETKKVRDEW